MPKLKNPRHELFCQLWATPGTKFYKNAAKSYIEAGYSENGANVSASKLLAKPNIRLRCDEIERENKDKLIERLEITQENTLREIADMAFSNITDVLNVDDKGNLYVQDLKELPRHVQAMIKKIHITNTTKGKGDDKYTEQRINLEFHGKERPLEMLAKHFGVLKEDGSDKGQSLQRTKEEVLKELADAGIDVKALEQSITRNRVH